MEKKKEKKPAKVAKATGAEIRFEIRDQMIVGIAAMALVAVLYFLFFATSLSWKNTGKEVGVIQTAGKVRRRPSGTLQWKNIVGSSQVYMRDVIYVPKDTTATLTLTGTTKSITVPPDTMFQLDDSLIDSIQITLVQGDKKTPEMPIYVRPKQSNGLLSDIQNLDLRVSELKQRTEDIFFNHSAIEQVRAMKPTPAFSPAFSDYTVKLVRPPLAEYNLKENRWMLMAWTKVPFKDVTYELQVAKDPEFSKVFYHKSKSNHLLIQYDEAKTYYWRVKGIRGGETVLSESGEFTLTMSGGLKNQLAAAVDMKNNHFEVATDVKFMNVVKRGLSSDEKCPEDQLKKGRYFCRLKSPTGAKVLKAYIMTVN